MTRSLALATAFALGATFGSFLNVCVHRWPRDESIVRPGSRCPQCERPIRWSENVPIFGWLMLRGRCAGCGLPISPQYPLVELLVALGWVLAAWAFGSTFTAVRVAVYGTVLLGIALTDLKHYLIPDGFTLFGVTFAIVTAIAAWWRGEPSVPFAGPYEALIGACAGAGVVAIIGWLGEVAMKREAMGMGDVTLMAFVGAAIGPDRAILTVFVASVIATMVFLGVVYPVLWVRARRAGPTPDALVPPEGEGAPELPDVPFGVFLAPAALVTLLWGDAILRGLVR